MSGQKWFHFTAKLAPTWIIWTNTQLMKSLEDLSEKKHNELYASSSNLLKSHHFANSYQFPTLSVQSRMCNKKQCHILTTYVWQAAKTSLKCVFLNTNILCTILRAKTCLTRNKLIGHECPILWYIYIATKKYTLYNNISLNMTESVFKIKIGEKILVFFF